MIELRSSVALASLATLLVVAPGRAQQSSWSAPRDSVRLSALLQQATATDPRQRQFPLSAAATGLRLANIDADKKPTLEVSGQAQYQSSVTTIPVRVPNFTVPAPPYDTYDAHLNAQQPLVSPTVAPRRAAERAQLAETQAELRVTLFSVRQDVNDAFFAALMAQEREAQVVVAIADLDARLRETAIRLREGTALPGDTAAIAATILQRRQDLAQSRADRRSALARLSELVHAPVVDSTLLVIPDLAAAVARAESIAPSETHARPEFAQFEATRASLAAQEAVATAQDRPKISAFGRVGYWRPGLNVLASGFQPYFLGGLQFDWKPWTWGTTSRDREVLELQRQIATTNERAFTDQIARSVQPFLATMARLDTATALDDRIVALRAEIERETAAKLREGAVTASEYADRSTDLLTARLASAQHRVELAQARAGYLNTLGLEIP
ncbi:MAG TPA: TolC family protein [Gemmatimonadaceae bacterium]